MKINYFEDTDTALIHFTEKKVVETREVSENVYLDLDEQGKNIIIPQPPKQQVPRLVSFVGHTYIDRPNGGVMRARCGRWAVTERARRQLDQASCSLSAAQQLLAQERVAVQAIELEVNDAGIPLTAPSCDIAAVAVQAAGRLERQWGEQGQGDQEEAMQSQQHGDDFLSAAADTAMANMAARRPAPLLGPLPWRTAYSLERETGRGVFIIEGSYL